MEVASLCPRSECSLSAGCRLTTAARERCLRDRTWAHWQSTAMASFTLLLPLASPLLLPLSLVGARTRLLPSSLAALVSAFFPLLTSPPVFLLILATGTGNQDLPPGARVRLRRLLRHPYLVRRLQHLGRIPFPFPPFPLPRCLHLLLSSLPYSRLFQLILPSSPPCPRFSRHLTLFFCTFVKSPSLLCRVAMSSVCSTVSAGVHSS